MNTGGFHRRLCPSCGSQKHVRAVYSKPPAETLSMNDLRPFWAGLHARKVFFSYDRCHDCGLLFAPEFFDDAQLADLYSDLAPNMDMVPLSAIEATQRSYFDAAVATGEDALKGGYLEIGPDIGHLARHAAREGRFDDFWLFEPNRAVHDQLADAVAPHPAKIFGELADISPVPDSSIGLAVMIQVLDHLLDPVHMLRQIHAKLRPGGTLMVVTHNEKSLLASILGPRWLPYCLQHPQVFNPQSIADMMHRAGYSTVKVRRSVNYFPIDFLVRQAGQAVGLKFDRLPLPRKSVGLKLGNIVTLASR